MSKLKVNDLFCGAGGMGIAFKKAGFKIAAAWDFDKNAVQSYKSNVGKHVKQADVTEMHNGDLPKAEIWTFGFPCQDLTKNGKMAGLFEGKRSGLFFQVMRLLDETMYEMLFAESLGEKPVSVLPKVIMAENVTGLKKYLDVLETEYAKRGYKMYHVLYNSKYWLPQNRERYFVVGVHESIDKEFVFPEEQKLYKPKLFSILEKEVDKSYFEINEKSLSIVSYENGEIRVKQATKKGYDVAVPGDSINLSHPNSKTRRGRVGKQRAQTLLTSKEQVVVLKDGRLRYFTEREMARLQGFPDHYKQVVSNGAFCKQMGNAVTINVVQAIAERIKIFLQSV